MLDVLMSQIVFKRSRVLTVICQLEPAGVAAHVGMDWERHLGGLPEPAHHATESHGTHGCSALAHEDVPSRLLLPLQSTLREAPDDDLSRDKKIGEKSLAVGTAGCCNRNGRLVSLSSVEDKELRR